LPEISKPQTALLSFARAKTYPNAACTHHCRFTADRRGDLSSSAIVNWLALPEPGRAHDERCAQWSSRVVRQECRAVAVGMAIRSASISAAVWRIVSTTSPCRTSTFTGTAAGEAALHGPCERPHVKKMDGQIVAGEQLLPLPLRLAARAAFPFAHVALLALTNATKAKLVASAQITIKAISHRIARSESASIDSSSAQDSSPDQSLVVFSRLSSITAIYPNDGFVKAGGLISYGASFPDIFRRAAGYVHNGIARDPNYQGKGLDLEFTVEDEGVFTSPWSASMIYWPPLVPMGQWPEITCVENMLCVAGGEHGCMGRLCPNLRQISELSAKDHLPIGDLSGLKPPNRANFLVESIGDRSDPILTHNFVPARCRARSTKLF
jgi:hypothetical protein